MEREQTEQAYRKLIEEEQDLNDKLETIERSSDRQNTHRAIITEIDSFLEHAERVLAGVTSFRRYRYISSLITSWSALRKAFVPASVGAGATSGGSAQGSAEIVDFPTSRGRDPLVNLSPKLRRLLTKDENDENQFRLPYVYTQYFDGNFGSERYPEEEPFITFINFCARYLTERLNREGMRVEPSRLRFDPDDTVEDEETLNSMLKQMFRFEILVPEPATLTGERQNSHSDRKFKPIGDFTSLRAVISDDIKGAILGAHYTAEHPPTLGTIIEAAKGRAPIVLRANTAMTDYVKSLLRGYNRTERPTTTEVNSNDQIVALLKGGLGKKKTQSPIALLDNGIYLAVRRDLPKGFDGYRIKLDRSLEAGYYVPAEDADFESMIDKAIEEAFLNEDGTWKQKFWKKLNEMEVTLHEPMKNGPNYGGPVAVVATSSDKAAKGES